MTARTFDTYAAVKNIVHAGADEKLAEAIVSVISRSDGDLVIQKDLQLLEQRLFIKLTGVVIATAIATGGMLFTLLQFFPPGSLAG